MKTLKKYEKFILDKNLNEGLKETFKKFWSNFKEKWGKKTLQKYLMFLDKAGKLLKDGKKKIDYYFPSSDSKPSINLDKVDISELESETGDVTHLIKDMVKESKVELGSKDPSIPDITIQELEELILKFFKMRKKYPDDTCSIFIWGAPGIAKTSIIRQSAEKLGVPSITWMLSQIEPIDFAGLPTVKDDRTQYALPGCFPYEDTSPEGGIIFLDELNRADPSVLAASLSLCLEGKVGYEYTLPAGWLVIAAGNRKEDIVGGRVTKIEPALSNRFAHVNLIYDVKDFTKYSTERGKETVHPDVLGFLTLYKDKLHHLDPDKPMMNWPTPRRWEKASKEYMFDLEEKGRLNRDEIRSIFAHHVGTALAGEFVSYMDVKKKFSEKDIQGIYAGDEKIKWPEKLDLNEKLAIVTFIAFYKKGEKVTEKELENIFKFALKIGSFEIATTLIQYFVHVHDYVKTEYKNTYTKLVKDWFTTYKKELAI